MRQRIIAVFLILCILFSFTACNAKVENESTTKTVTDFLGREVEIPAHPQRVACLYASIAHMMCLLEQTDKVVGCPAGVKRDIVMQAKFPNYESLAVPYQSGSINVEELVSLDADLVLIRNSTAQAAAETEKLEKLGIPYVVVDYFSMDDTKAAITLMGEIFDVQDKAKAYNDFYDSTIALVDDALEGLSDDEKYTVYHSVNEDTRTDVAGSLCAEIITRAGLVDISAVENSGLISEGEKSYTTLEEIYKWNPDAIIANEYAVTENILTDPKWSGLDSVRNGMVYTLPVGATRWAHPGSIESHMATLAIAMMFYPDRFEDIDLYEYVHDYYNTYWGLDFDDDTITMILSGKGMRLPKRGEKAA